MDTKYAFLSKPMAFYGDWLNELEAFRAKYAGRIVDEGVSFGVYAICWIRYTEEPKKKAK